MCLNHEVQAHRLYFYCPVDTKKFSFAAGIMKEEFLFSSVSWTCCAKKFLTSLPERGRKICLESYLRNFSSTILRPSSGKASTFNIWNRVRLSMHPSGMSRREHP